VTYRALKAQFQLDDELLETLKEELLFSHLVVDEDGRGLVWTGDTEATPVTTSQPGQPEPQPVVEQAQSIQATLPPIEPHMPDAERRQLTVMFCDLVDSTRLASQLDPEDYREVVREYQRVCSEVITRFDGHIAQYLGDGLLVYFGYPQAHEDDAQRAVRTGLGIVEAIRSLNTRLEQDKGIELAVRLGVHTGPVVVGEMGGEGRQEQLALGETPNIAARIQGLAEPNTVMVSDATYRLVQGFFDFGSLGEHDLRGVSQPIAIYRVLRESGAQSRLEVASTRGLTPLVGRESESTLLFERWGQAKDGNGQVILLSGEAGIGKSRLVQVLKDHVANELHTRIECRSSPYFTNSALYPITDFLQRVLRFQPDDTPEQKLEKLTQNLRHYRLPLEETVPLFGALLSLPVPDEGRYPPLNLSPQRQRQKTLEAIVAIILELSERQPVLFILEDLHWTDPTTLEFLGLLVDQTPTVSLYALLTCRPEFQPSWSHRSYLTEVTVNRLSHSQIEQLAEQVAGEKRLPEEVVRQLVDKTDGVPLYVEEMTKAVLESGALKDVNGYYELAGSLSSLTIPSSLQDSLMSRLDRLVTAKAVAQYAAVIGRQFSYELLHAVSQLDESMLQHELGRLVEAELVYQRGLPPQATYIFKHALVQDTAYESLLRSARQGYHLRIAEVLEERFPETAETHPELLANHYTAAGMHEQAVDYWQQAGERAIARSAYQEAIAHLTAGVEALMTLPETTNRSQRELDLCLILGPALMTLRGFGNAEVEQVYHRAHELCQRLQLDESPQFLQVLFGLCRVYVQHAVHKTQAIAEQALSLAQRLDDLPMVVDAYYNLGTVLLIRGAFTASLEHYRQGLALAERLPSDASIVAFGRTAYQYSLVFRSLTAQSLWFLGYPEQARQAIQETLPLAQEEAHPFTLSFIFWAATFIAHYRRDIAITVEHADTAAAFLRQHGFILWLGWMTVMKGWAWVAQGWAEDGREHIQQGMQTAFATDSVVCRPYFLALLAEAHGKLGQPEAALSFMDEAFALVEQTGEHHHLAEIHRLKGEFLLSQSSDSPPEAEHCFHQALNIARHQQAKSWELRAATSLARLWQSQGKRQDAYDLLAPVYGWFTEGFDTADLIDAKALLDELS
jgi:class 3 adenylate cyclase/predicted ATPase